MELNSTAYEVLPGYVSDLDFDCFFPSNDTDENYTCIYDGPSIRMPKDPSYYSLKYQIVGTLFQGIVLIVGVLGNIMVVIVVTRTRSMHTPTNCYLVSLSIADFMTLIASVPNEILAYYLLGDEWIWGRVGCALFIFFQYLGINVSSLSITAFTVERYIAICHPMKAQIVCTVSRAKKIIIGVWIFACLYCSPWLFLTKIKPLHYKGLESRETCTFALGRNSYLGYYFTDIILFYVFPLILSCILYGLIARVLFSRNIQNGKSNGMMTPQEQRKSSPNATNARAQVVKMLAVVVAVFALLWLPYRVLLVYNSFAQRRYMELWFLMFCKTMIFINSAINPILYNAMSIKFRRAFKIMLSCGKTRRRIKGPYISVAGSIIRRQHQTVTSQITSCTMEPLQIL
ncbi:thyrotropin-releasing hormone receptor-like [Parasteatoda tepidariorum]|uniref:thyrotropin-releasing hormone receptor-like n=1 Tax=Parasteatoda tepidariorum TaxID=114398 RepID=UPI00077FDFB6|nr:thyrotropin-releasing hormone receptor-like [Parasteatoda tepidariorum]